MRQFWEIFYAHDEKKWELVRKTSDDTLFTNNVSALQKAGFDVTCQTSDGDVSKQQRLLDYDHEEGLYQKYLLRYENQTGTPVKRW
jgi:hypothetical protein